MLFGYIVLKEKIELKMVVFYIRVINEYILSFFGMLGIVLGIWEIVVIKIDGNCVFRGIFYKSLGYF